MKPLLVVTLAWVLFTSGVAAEDTLEKQLAHQYRDKVLILRHSFKSNSQEYAADGTPLVDLVHVLGMGLDDSAVATVGTWRFDPATKDGRPVAVAAYVEVDFRLY